MSPDQLAKGSRVYRYVYSGSSGSFDVNTIQPLTVERINRKSVSVLTDQGSRFRIESSELVGLVDWEEE